MATIPEGMSASHFDIMFTHWGETLTLNRYDETTSNITGNVDDINYGDDEPITGIMITPKQRFVLEKEGFVEQGDTYLMLKYSTHSSNPPSKRDKVTKSTGETFKIKNVLNRRDLYYFCEMYKID